VKISEIHDSFISGLSCSPEGILYMLDTGLSSVYRVDLNNGDCTRILQLESAVDIVYFGIFVVILTKTGVIMLNPMGKLIQTFSTSFPSLPVAVTHNNDSIIVTCQAADICILKIDII
jgi:hypothetical protein